MTVTVAQLIDAVRSEVDEQVLFTICDQFDPYLEAGDDDWGKHARVYKLSYGCFVCFTLYDEASTVDEAIVLESEQNAHDWFNEFNEELREWLASQDADEDFDDDADNDDDDDVDDADDEEVEDEDEE